MQNENHSNSQSCLHDLLEQMKSCAQSLRGHLNEIKEQAEFRYSFAALKLYLLLDFWECSFLAQVREFVSIAQQELDSLISQFVTLQEKAQQMRRLEIIDQLPTLSEQLSKLTSVLTNSNAIGILGDRDGFPGRLRLGLTTTSPEEDVFQLAKFYAVQKEKGDGKSWQIIENLLQLLGVEVHVSTNPNDLPSLESLHVLSRPIASSDVKTILIQIKSTIHLLGKPLYTVKDSGDSVDSYLVLCCGENARGDKKGELINSLKDCLKSPWPPQLAGLVQEIREILQKYLCAALQPKRDLLKDSFRLLNQLLAQYNQGEDPSQVQTLLRLWYRFVSDELRLDVLPRLPDDINKMPTLTPGVFENLKNNVYFEYDHESQSEPGAIMKFEAFWCSGFAQEEKPTWSVSTGRCPEKIRRAARLSCEGLASNRLKQHVETIQKLLVDSSPPREDNFLKLCQNLKSNIEKHPQTGHLAEDLDKLYRATAGYLTDGSVTKAQAEAWLKHLCEDVGVRFDPAIPEPGDHPRCNDELWRERFGSDHAELPAGVQVSDEEDGVPKGYVLQCKFASVNPDCAKYIVSLGPRDRWPRSLRLARELNRAADSLGLQEFQPRFQDLFRREAFYFLTDVKPKPWSGDEIKEVLQFLFRLRNDEKERASQLFTELRQLLSEAGWSLEPEEYKLSDRYQDLSESAQAVVKLIPDDEHDFGFISPQIDDVDDSNRRICLALHVHIGRPLKYFREIKEILEAHSGFKGVLSSLESIPRRIAEAQAGGEDSRQCLVNAAIEFYKEFTDKFPENKNSLEDGSDSSELNKAIKDLRCYIDESLKSLGLEFWQPQSKDEARQSAWVDTVGQVPGANDFVVVRRGLKLGDKNKLACKVEWVRRDEI